MANRRQYKNPPLVEILTEFFFVPAEGIEWDSFIVPAFHRRIAAGFPTRKRLPAVGIEVRMSSGGDSPEFKPLGLPTPRHRFISEDEKTLVQLGENLLVVNQLPPYYGWEKYRPRVVECFNLYVKLWKPTRVGRVAVHYINKIDLPEVEAGLEEYFNLLPTLPDFPLQPVVTNLSMSYEVPGSNFGDIMVVSMKQHSSANPDGMTFLFQWDYIASDGLPCDSEAQTEWLDQAHEYLYKVFMSTLTDKCRKLFE